MPVMHQPLGSSTRRVANRHHVLFGRVLTSCCLLLTSCGSPDKNEPTVEQSGGQAGSVSASGGAMSGGAGGLGAGATSGSGGESGSAPVEHVRCQAPPGMSAPGTIEQVVALLNALPKPTDVSCLVESLERPLVVFATNSTFSAQPALSTASPRVFIKLGDLWLSIVIDGKSSELLEFGYQLNLPDTFRSIKGELHFPLPTSIEPSAPFDRVLYQNGTACQLCHYEEQAEDVAGVASAFSSIAFRPRPDGHVNLDWLREAARTCNRQAEPRRCEMLSAVFDGGPVVEGSFPETMPTFF